MKPFDHAELLITSIPPSDWRDLQRQVARVFQECGLVVEIEKDIQTVRGNVEVDVFAKDSEQRPPVVYLCECKRWKSRVPKNVVHALETVVANYGANWGIIISSVGFQRGAYEASQQTNLRLLDWNEFQKLFAPLWVERFMIPRIREGVAPLLEYDSAIKYRFDEKRDDKLTPFIKKWHEDYILKYGLILLFARSLQRASLYQKLTLPIKGSLPKLLVPTEEKLINQPLLMEAAALREFLEAFIDTAQKAVAELQEDFRKFSDLFFVS